MRKFWLTVGWLLLISPAIGHVGSPGVVFEGDAGPYHLLVSVNPPDVIPGTAQVSIYCEEGGIRKIGVQPIYWYAGDEGSPEPDLATPVEGVPGQYEGMIWLMDHGTASLSVTVEGSQGEGSVIVPVMAVATAQREMGPELGWILSGLGILLVVLMITIVGASVSDGTLAPGEERNPSLKRKRISGMVGAVVVLGLILYMGNSWWTSWAEDYRRYMYLPPKATSTIVSNGSEQLLQLQLDKESFGERDVAYLIPDHGKLMHLFLMREGSLDVFAHLHPKRTADLTYEVVLPPVPTGRYFVYADVVRHSGFTETIVSNFEVAEPKMEVQFASYEENRGDPDDTYIVSNPVTKVKTQLSGFETVIVCGKPGIETPLHDGSTAVWEYDGNTPFEAGKVYPLTFSIQDPEGEPAELEPYMGMMGHAVVLKNDGSVYVHLHPIGNYSMASQQAIEDRIAQDQKLPELPAREHFMDSVDREVNRIAALTEEDRNDYFMELMGHVIPTDSLTEDDEHAWHETSSVTFPYSFPEPGDYRVWIQMKRAGKILNSAYDVTVE